MLRLFLDRRLKSFSHHQTLILLVTRKRWEYLGHRHLPFLLLLRSVYLKSEKADAILVADQQALAIPWVENVSPRLTWRIILWRISSLLNRIQKDVICIVAEKILILATSRLVREILICEKYFVVLLLSCKVKCFDSCILKQYAYSLTTCFSNVALVMVVLNTSLYVICELVYDLTFHLSLRLTLWTTLLMSIPVLVSDKSMVLLLDVYDRFSSSMSTNYTFVWMFKFLWRMSL